MKHQTINLVKFKAFARRLNEPLCNAVGILESLWIFCQIQARDGDLTKFSALEIAGWIEYQGDENQLVEALVETGWIDRFDDGRLSVHGWEEHKPNWLKGVEKKQSKSLPGSVPGSVLGSEPGSVPGSEPSTEPPNLTQPNPTKPNPITPKPPAAGAAMVAVVDFRGVESALADRGVTAAVGSVQTARQRGCSATELMAVVRAWDDRQPDSTPASLSWRIANSVPGRKPTEGWPEPRSPPLTRPKRIPSFETWRASRVRQVKPQELTSEIEGKLAEEYAARFNETQKGPTDGKKKKTKKEN